MLKSDEFTYIYYIYIHGPDLGGQQGPWSFEALFLLIFLFNTFFLGPHRTLALGPPNYKSGSVYIMTYRSIQHNILYYMFN